MSWVWLVVAAWVGFIVGFCLCAVFAINNVIWTGDVDND